MVLRVTVCHVRFTQHFLSAEPKTKEEAAWFRLPQPSGRLARSILGDKHLPASPVTACPSSRPQTYEQTATPPLLLLEAHTGGLSHGSTGNVMPQRAGR